MSNFPSLTPSEIIKILKKNNFVIDRIRGSHYILIHIELKKRVVIPMHKSDLPEGTLHEIIKQSGLVKEYFFKK